MTPYYRHVSEAANALISQGLTAGNTRKTLILGLSPLIVALGVTLVHAQSSQSLPAKVGLSKQECAAAGVYRDSILFRDWDQAQTQLRDVTIRFQGLREAKDVLHTSKSDLEFVTALGTIAHRAKAMANLTENLAKLLFPEAKLSNTTLDLINAYNTAYDPLGAARDAVAALHPITQALHTVHTLASDASNTTRSKAISSEINAQLTSQMAHLSKNIKALELSAVALNGQVRNLQDFKSNIDTFCGGVSGCAIPGSTVSNRIGTTKCLVDVVSALCPSCKSGYRHRCEPLGKGALEWRPIEECLPNELKNAKSGASRQQTAAALFSAQAADLASTPTKEQRVVDQRRREADAAGIANAMRRGAAQAEERNQQLRVMEAAEREAAENAHQNAVRCPPIGRCAPESRVACEC